MKRFITLRKLGVADAYAFAIGDSVQFGAAGSIGAHGAVQTFMPTF